MKPTNISKTNKIWKHYATKKLKSAAIISLRQTWLVSCYRRAIDHVELTVEAFLGCSVHSFTRWLTDWLISLICSSSMIRSTLSRLHRSETPPVMLCREPKRWINTKTHFLFSTITHWLCIHTKIYMHLYKQKHIHNACHVCHVPLHVMCTLTKNWKCCKDDSLSNCWPLSWPP